MDKSIYLLLILLLDNIRFTLSNLIQIKSSWLFFFLKSCSMKIHSIVFLLSLNLYTFNESYKLILPTFDIQLVHQKNIVVLVLNNIIKYSIFRTNDCIHIM